MFDYITPFIHCTGFMVCIDQCILFLPFLTQVWLCERTTPRCHLINRGDEAIRVGQTAGHRDQTHAAPLR